MSALPCSPQIMDYICIIQISSALPFGPDQKRMHSYMVPIFFGVHSHMVSLAFWSALRYGHFSFWECTLIWSLTTFGVHSDMVLIILKNALRSGPPLYYQTARRNILFVLSVYWMLQFSQKNFADFQWKMKFFISFCFWSWTIGYYQWRFWKLSIGVEVGPNKNPKLSKLLFDAT